MSAMLSLFEHPMYDAVSRAIRASGCTTKRPGEMAELIENPTRGSDPSRAERDSTPRNLQYAVAGTMGWRRMRARKRRLLGIPESGCLAGRLPNGVTLSALIMKVDASTDVVLQFPGPGTFFLRTFVESFEFPGLRDAAARWRRLLAAGDSGGRGWMARGFCRYATGYVRKK